VGLTGEYKSSACASRIESERQRSPQLRARVNGQQPSRQIGTRGDQAEGPTYIIAERRALCVCVAAASTERSRGVEQCTEHSKPSLSGVFSFTTSIHLCRPRATTVRKPRASRTWQSLDNPTLTSSVRVLRSVWSQAMARSVDVRRRRITRSGWTVARVLGECERKLYGHRPSHNLRAAVFAAHEGATESALSTRSRRRAHVRRFRTKVGWEQTERCPGPGEYWGEVQIRTD
jgi:hypothetical protein